MGITLGITLHRHLMILVFLCRSPVYGDYSWGLLSYKAEEVLGILVAPLYKGIILLFPFRRGLFFLERLFYVAN